ncbi:VanZ family protein [Desulfobulbus rhabdoformis]|uniref:VanZ family protein n=1 Tax=Desulfobulbus rhabdoformis TaxID=34032 RepID=UPI00196586BD|nr:VanZ family protein [Desulfobulbus rhabdoformis]MBM9616205.1 VanZ family protein [Desulfobulbus rhabdoformis]
MRWILRMVPLFMVMGGIFYLSHQPGSTLHLPEFYSSDKLLHMLAYAILGGAYLLGLKPFWRERFPFVVGSTLVLCLVYGLLDEYHQSFIPGRSVSGGDVAADFLGGVMAVLLLFAWRKILMVQKEGKRKPHLN